MATYIQNCGIKAHASQAGPIVFNVTHAISAGQSMLIAVDLGTAASPSITDISDSSGNNLTSGDYIIDKQDYANTGLVLIRCNLRFALNFNDPISFTISAPALSVISVDSFSNWIQPDGAIPAFTQFTTLNAWPIPGSAPTAGDVLYALASAFSGSVNFSIGSGTFNLIANKHDSTSGVCTMFAGYDVPAGAGADNCNLALTQVRSGAGLVAAYKDYAGAPVVYNGKTAIAKSLSSPGTASSVTIISINPPMAKSFSKPGVAQASTVSAPINIQGTAAFAKSFAGGGIARKESIWEPDTDTIIDVWRKIN